MSVSHVRNLVLSLVIVQSLAAQVATNDLFDRPNSNSLGVDWVEQDGDSKIANNQLLANSLFTYGWCSHSAYQAPYAQTVVRAKWSMNGGGGDSISLASGVDTASWSGIEVKISDQNGDGLADRIIFNAAVNAGAWYTSPSFVNMTTPLASGQATTWFSNGGDTVNIELVDLTTLQTQTYSASGILANPPTGTRVGIGYFGNGMVDDFRAWTGDHTSPTYTLTTPRSNLPTTLLITDVPSFAPVAVAYSVAGAGPIITPLGIVGLSDPIEIFFQSVADSTGRLELPLGTLGPMTGVTIHTQAIELTTPALTNYFTVVVL